MKKYLLIAGHNFYPQAGTDDWRGCYDTYEEAKARITTEETPILYTSGKRMNEVKEIYKTYYLDGYHIDWYDIVDLEAWMNR